MSIYEFAKRVQTLRDREHIVALKEVTLSKASAKHFKAIINLESQIGNQLKALNAVRARTKQLTAQNKTLQQYAEQRKQQLLDAKVRITQLHQTVEQRSIEQIQKRQYNLLEINKLQTLKECSKILINLRALPNLVQGIKLCEKLNTTTWVPFRIEPLRHSQEEVQNAIWQYHGPFAEQWEELFFGDFCSGEHKNENIVMQNDTINND